MPEDRLESLAKRIYAAYAALPEADGKRVEPELLARSLLGVKVVYRRLSPDGGILGITAPGPVAVPVAEEGEAWFFLDGQTVLLDRGLLSPWVPAGRRRFTLMHELSHLLLAAAPDNRPCYLLSGPPQSRDERRANRLAAALLMPEELLRRDLAGSGWQPGPLADRRLDPARWRRFGDLAETLGVSRQALAIRLERLGLLRQGQVWTLGPARSLGPDEEERSRLEE